MGVESNPTLAVVVIGRNEGERLRRCFSSIESMRQPAGGIEIVYVDSDSSDESPLIAEQAGIRAIRLFPEEPTAARARNAGWRATCAPFVLFVDGDCQIEQDFAVQALEKFQDPDVAVVWGRLREAFPSASIYNRLMDIQWVCLRDMPAGPTFYGTGIALVRRSALEAAGGFCDSLTAGENTELGRRLQSLGYSVLHVELPMVRHDAAILRFSQYWRRFVRDGYSYARLRELFRDSVQPLFRFEFSVVGGGLLIAAPAAAVAGYALHGSWLVPALVAGALFTHLARTTLQSLPKVGSLRDAMLFSIHWHFKLIPNLFGHLAYLLDKRLGRRRGLIEYR